MTIENVAKIQSFGGNFMGYGRKTKKDRIVAWRLENPASGKKECKAELGISYPTIRLYWDNCGLEKELSAREIVISWCKKNPKGLMSFCMEETGLCYRTVKKYWAGKPVSPKSNGKMNAQSSVKKTEIKAEVSHRSKEDKESGQLDLFSFFQD